jgi:hypothetical protein
MIKQVQTSKDSCLYRISLAYHHYRATCLEVGQMRGRVQVLPLVTLQTNYRALYQHPG